MKNCKFEPCNCQIRQQLINHEPKPEANHELINFKFNLWLMNLFTTKL